MTIHSHFPHWCLWIACVGSPRHGLTQSLEEFEIPTWRTRLQQSFLFQAKYRFILTQIMSTTEMQILLKNSKEILSAATPAWAQWNDWKCPFRVIYTSIYHLKSKYANTNTNTKVWLGCRGELGWSGEAGYRTDPSSDCLIVLFPLTTCSWNKSKCSVNLCSNLLLFIFLLRKGGWEKAWWV